MKNYIYATERQGGLSDIKAWHKGESEYLKDLIGVGFWNTIYICKNGLVTFYCREDEATEFEKALDKFTEEQFDNLCTDFMLLCDEIPTAKTDQEKLKLFSKMIPALTIFFEYDEYPDYMNDNMARRLIRVRTSTEAKPYELLKDVGVNDPKDFILYQGKVYLNTLTP